MTRVKMWFHKALLDFRMFFTINFNDPRNFDRYRSIEMMKLEQEVHLRRYKVRIHPHSRFRVLWETFYCGYIVVNILSSFILLCISKLAPISSIMLLIMPQLAGDSVLLLNIVLNLISGVFSDDQDEAVMSFSAIWRHYFNSFFLFDLIGLVFGSPALFFVTWSSPRIFYFDVVFLVKALAIYSRVLSAWHYWRNSVAKYFMIDGLTSSVFELILFLPVPISFLACLGFSAITDNDYDAEAQDDVMDVINSYFHLSISVWLCFDVIEKLTHPIFVVLDTIFILYPYIKYFIVATFLILILWSRRGSANRYNTLLKNLTQYLQQVRISERLKIRIGRYYEEIFQGSFYSEPYILENVSSELREEILSFKLSRIREEIAILKMLPINELLLIGKHLVLEVYFGNDVIAYSGNIHDRMYFLARGSIAVYTDAACELQHISNPMHFLAGGILLNKPLIRLNYLACDTTTLYSLSRTDFITIMDQCPVFIELLKFGYEIHTDVVRFLEEKENEIEESQK